MDIYASSEKDLVNKYLQLAGYMAGWNKRETEVAVAMVLVYAKLHRNKAAGIYDDDEDTKDLDIMGLLRRPETLHNIALYLGMHFSSFRNYVSKLKTKGFFVGGSINPVFLVLDIEKVVTINIKYVGDKKET